MLLENINQDDKRSSFASNEQEHTNGKLCCWKILIKMTKDLFLQVMNQNIPIEGNVDVNDNDMKMTKDFHLQMIN